MDAVAKRMTQVGLSIVFGGVLLFGGAGRFDWLWAWIYLGLATGFVVMTGLLLLPSHRDVIAERAGVGQGAKAWDRWLGGGTAVFSSVFGLLVAGLDARFGWTLALPLRTHLIGVGCFLAGSGLLTWAMAANRFFSIVVRIQKDRGHTVVDAGPYAVVRHPGYVGWIVSALAVPLVLGSAWALVPAGIGVVLMIVRTVLEDRTLREELPGYADYAARVRFRLLPGVW